jgi:hypothetical protein
MRLNACFTMSVLLAVAASLSGCATGATTAGMIIRPEELVRPTSPAVQHAVAIEAVGGGSETNAMWASQVGNLEFKAALSESLKAAGILADGPARYTLVAALISLDQPTFGFDMTVTAKVQYAVTDTTTNAVVWHEVVTTPHTATTSDSLAGVTRLRLANEGAMRKNIARLIERLGAASLQGPITVN